MFLDNSYIYICTGEHDNNIISLHDIDWKIKMNNRHISLMLLSTLKIVSCLKNYCCHNDNNTHIVKLTTSTPSMSKNMFHMSLTINYNWSLTYFWNQV